MNKQDLYDENGNPSAIVCFDNGGETFDRYTVIFLGEYTHLTGGVSWYVGMSENPFHPQGFGQHGEIFGEYPVDISYVVGDFWDGNDEVIPFSDLPKACQELVMQDYKELWEEK